MYCLLAFVILFTSIATGFKGCSTKLSILGFGSSVTEYAVSCLPDVVFNVSASYAGQIPIPGTTNDELFFWLFEAEDQSKKDNLISECAPSRCWYD